MGYDESETHNPFWEKKNVFGMANYIDGFVFPIQKIHLDEYKKASEKIAEIWKEHGAISYHEFIGDDMYLEGTKSFEATINAKENEVVVFGWVVFPTKEVRDMANKNVPTDSRMNALVSPLIDPNNLIFDARRMVYGGFKPLS